MREQLIVLKEEKKAVGGAGRCIYIVLQAAMKEENEHPLLESQAGINKI
jgi:hypothetical protein